MKRYLLIALVLFAAMFAIWFMVDRWQKNEIEEITETDEREVFGLTATGGADSAEEKDTETPTEAQETPVSSDGSPEPADQGKLETKAREYAEDIVKGLTSRVLEGASEKLKEDTSEDDLELSYESVTSGLGSFQGMESVTNSTRDGYREITTTLRYEGNEGASIRFIFDGDEALAGIWFDTVKLASAPDKGSRYEEIEKKIGRTPYVLDACLTIPIRADEEDEKEKPPLVILVSDRDDADMDGTMGAAGNTPLLDMAHGLALRGVATLRYNRRHQQYPETAYTDSDIRETLLKDVWAAVDTANYLGKIDTDSIFLLVWGRSAEYLPAMIEKRNRRVKGAILIGAKPTKHEELDYIDETLKTESDAKYFVTNSTFPLMFLQGDRDFETPVKYFEKWQSLLTGRAHTAYHLYKSLGHFLFEGGTEEPGPADYDEKNTVNTGAITDIANWVAGL